MLQLTQSLPSSALLGQEAADLASHAALWLSSGAESVVRDGDKITGWRASNGSVAWLSEPNQGNSHFEPGAPGAYAFQTGVHCGFWLPEVAESADHFTAAVIWSTAGADARSLLALSTGQSNNLIFLSETDGVLVAKDRGNAVAVELPLAASGYRLAVLSYDGQALTLRAGGQSVTASGRAAQMDCPADLFIGCRSNRNGLTKTLGAARIHDVLFWPHRALLGSDAPQDVAALASLERYHRWTY